MSIFRIILTFCLYGCIGFTVVEYGNDPAAGESREILIKLNRHPIQRNHRIKILRFHKPSNDNDYSQLHFVNTPDVFPEDGYLRMSSPLCLEGCVGMYTWNASEPLKLDDYKIEIGISYDKSLQTVEKVESGKVGFNRGCGSNREEAKCDYNSIWDVTFPHLRINLTPRSDRAENLLKYLSHVTVRYVVYPHERRPYFQRRSHAPFKGKHYTSTHNLESGTIITQHTPPMVFSYVTPKGRPYV